jgi:hypothetical protein
LGEQDVVQEFLKAGSRRDASNEYVHFDEIEDVLSSVDLVALTAPLVRTNPSFWKWVIIGAHSALQGAMVCVLADTTGTGALMQKSAAKMMAWLSKRERSRGTAPPERLAEFDVLLARCLAACPNGDPLILTPEQLQDIRGLHQGFRNNFAHFTPKGWSIEKSGLPRITGVAIGTVRQLMRRPEVMNRMSGNKLRRLKKALDATDGALAEN